MPALLPAATLAAKIRGREISARELLDLYLARIEKLDAELNSVVTVDAERARRRADEADAALARGDSWGPLHGLPMTIKDVFEVAGMRTTAGSPVLAEHVPQTNAVAAQRLIDAGAVIFGKTNVPLMAGDVQSYNQIFGTTNNPWNTERTPGGSSGGSACALAMGFTAAEYGSDIGGSIRTPCHWNGLFGHKPTWGIVPGRGHIPGPPGMLAEGDLGVVGPIGRSAADLSLLLDVTAGPLADKARAWRLELPPPRRERLRDYRVALWIDDESAPLDAEVREKLEAAAGALRNAGVAVTAGPPPGLDLEAVVRNYMQLLFPITLAGFPPEVFERMSEMAATLPAGDESMLARVARFGTGRHRDWLVANEMRARCRAAVAEFFERVDVLLCPVTPVVAIPHDHSDPMPLRTIQIDGRTRPYADLFRWIALATMAHLPASVAPVGLGRSGLPVGVQIVGPYLEDRTTIDFAARLEELLGGFVPPPRARA